MMQSLVQFFALTVAAVSLVCAVLFFQHEMNGDAAKALCLYLASSLVAMLLNE